MKITNNYNKQPTFGAFIKGNEHVTTLFEKAILKLEPQQRDSFVSEVRSIIEQQKNNPIDIIQEIGYNDYDKPAYIAKIGNLKVVTKKLTPNVILKAMKRAATEADKIFEAESIKNTVKSLFE